VVLLPILLLGVPILIGVFFRYVLKRPGVTNDDAAQDPRRWSSLWF
jgi:hypothetical protein